MFFFFKHNSGWGLKIRENLQELLDVFDSWGVVDDKSTPNDQICRGWCFPLASVFWSSLKKTGGGVVIFVEGILPYQIIIMIVATFIEAMPGFQMNGVRASRFGGAGLSSGSLEGV